MLMLWKPLVYPVHLWFKLVKFKQGFCDAGTYSTYGCLLIFAKTADTSELILPVLCEVLLAHGPVVQKLLSSCEQLQSEPLLCAAASQLSSPV